MYTFVPFPPSAFLNFSILKFYGKSFRKGSHRRMDYVTDFKGALMTEVVLKSINGRKHRAGSRWGAPLLIIFSKSLLYIGFDLILIFVT